MVALINLPQYRPSPLLDLSGVNQALDQRQAMQFQNARAAEDQRRWQASNALAQGKFGLDQAAAAREAEAGPLRIQLIEQQIAQMRQQGATEAQMAPLRMEQMRAQTTLAQAQAKAAGQKDELNSAIAGMFRSSLPQQGQPAQGNPIQPQSFEGGVVSTDPNLIRTQTAAPNALGPQQGQPVQAQPPPDTVNTPVGPMTTEQAQRMGFALGLAGKGDAGKMLIESANANKLDKAARNEVEKDIVGLTGTIGRLESIKTKFDPKFLEIPQRVGFAWAALKDKFGSLPDEQKGQLRKYTQFRQVAVQNAALYVKYLSGVAVSEPEFRRIMTTLPNAGTGIGDGDSPEEFLAKMNEAIRQAKMATARAIYLRNQGTKGKPWEAGLALDDMPDMIDRRGAQLEQLFQQQGLPPDQLRGRVRQQLKQEFGI